MKSQTWKVVELSSQTMALPGSMWAHRGAGEPPFLLDMLAGAVEVAALEQHRLLDGDGAAGYGEPAPGRAGR